MEQLHIIFRSLIDKTSTDFKRFLTEKINWESRLIAIIGARGTGKTTLMLQKIKSENEINKTMYASLDNIYFSAHNVFDFAGHLYKYGIRKLYLDEVHKYKGWSQEVKNIYDSWPDMKIVISGSSMLDLYKGVGDLSRRVVPYSLPGMSFREYLAFENVSYLNPLSIEDILNHKLNYTIENPLLHFHNFLRTGYYPFYKEDDYALRLNGIIQTVLEQDIPKYLELRLSTVDKIKQLLMLVSENVPFKPNYQKIADILGISRNIIPDYFSYLEKAGLIMQLHNNTKGIRSIGKVSKVYLNNTNLAFALKGENVNTRTLRETFFMNQLQARNNIFATDVGDFIVNNTVFEIGGRNKTKNQIKNLDNAIIVKDDIEYGFGNTVPLWHFGFLY